MDLLGWLRPSSLSISVLACTSTTSILGDVLVCHRLLPRPSPSGKGLSVAVGDAGGLAGGSASELLVSGAGLVLTCLGIR